MSIEQQFPGGVWKTDFEYQQGPGENPVPLCIVARDLVSGRLVRRWLAGGADDRPPFPVDDSAVMVAYYASAEAACFLSLGWSMPVHVIDLFAEFRVATNGLLPPAHQGGAGSSLLGALAYYGLPAIADGEKDRWRQVAMRGGPFTEEERDGLIDYCQSDVDALAGLWSKMAPSINLHHALLRGRYAKAVAKMERVGIPIDTPLLNAFRENWDSIKRYLIEQYDIRFTVDGKTIDTLERRGTAVSPHLKEAVGDVVGVYDGLTFKRERFLLLCEQAGMPWPRHPSGALDLREQTFRGMAEANPALQPLHQLRTTLGKLRLEDLQVGADGCNRCMLSMFRSKTGRNQPSNSKFVFGPSAWARSLIKPEPGQSIVYIDWAQQEFGEAAYCSGDENMIAAYEHGDPYIMFAEMAGAVPLGTADRFRLAMVRHDDAALSTLKKLFGKVRDRYKSCALGVLYGMGPEALGLSVGGGYGIGIDLLSAHRRVFRRFWQWSDAVVQHGLLMRRLTAAFGWTLHVGKDTKVTTLANFPNQANGAEMMRLACIRATEQGVAVAAPIHDALLIIGAQATIERDIACTQEAMRWASRQVLGGPELRSDVQRVDAVSEDSIAQEMARGRLRLGRYIDGRGLDIWDAVIGFLFERGVIGSRELL